MSAPAADEEQLLLDFFTDDDWFPQPQGDGGVLGMRFEGRAGAFECFVELRRPPGQLLFYSVLPTHVAEPQRLRMAEAITWLNESLLVGNFELDLAAGQVRFKTSILLGEEPLPVPLLRQMVYINVTTMDRCQAILVEVTESDEAPGDIAAQLWS